MFQLTTQYKKGIIKLAVLLALLCFFIVVVKNYPVNEPEFVLNEEVQCGIENQRLIDESGQQHLKFKWNVNKLTDFQAYQLGLHVKAIDSLFNYRKQGGVIFSLEQFQKISLLKNSSRIKLLRMKTTSFIFFLIKNQELIRFTENSN